MQFKTKALLLSFMIASASLPSTALASDEECAIWLCLPAGFPSNPSGLSSSITCADAKSAMIKRIKDLKPPLPPFPSCVMSGQLASDMKSQDGYATYVPAHRVCTRWWNQDSSRCMTWDTVPEQWTHSRPSVCDRTREPVNCQQVRYVKVFSDGVQAGGTYYFNMAGQGRLIGGDKSIHEYLRNNP